MKALNVISKTVKGNYTYSIMGDVDKAKFIHIDNHKTHNNSVMVPLEDLEEALSQYNNIDV